MVTNPSSIHEDAGSIPASLSGLRIRHCLNCGVGFRYSSDSALLWLWYRPAAAAPIRPLAWELPYATGVAKKKIKQTKLLSHYKISKLSRLFCTRENFSTRYLLVLALFIFCKSLFFIIALNCCVLKCLTWFHSILLEK